MLFCFLPLLTDVVYGRIKEGYSIGAVIIGVEIAQKYREHKEIIHAIEAHHNDTEPTTALDFIIQAADAISAAVWISESESVRTGIEEAVDSRRETAELYTRDAVFPCGAICSSQMR